LAALRWSCLSARLRLWRDKAPFPRHTRGLPGLPADAVGAAARRAVAHTLLMLPLVDCSCLPRSLVPPPLVPRPRRLRSVLSLTRYRLPQWLHPYRSRQLSAMRLTPPGLRPWFPAAVPRAPA